MLKLYPLYSGSSGNMYMVSSDNCNIVVDIGISYKRFIEAIESIDKSVSDIDALFITHEHIDHIKGLVVFANNNPKIPIYLTCGTKEYIIGKYMDKFKCIPNFIDINYNEAVLIKDIKVTSLEISHDACMPTSYNLSKDNHSITIATDLGYVSENVYKALSKSDFNVIESNYDKNLLYYGPYSYPLKRRIDSKIGHLSNEEMADTLISLAKLGKRNFLLAHISENNNNESQVLSTAIDTIKLNGYDTNEFNINIATRYLSQEVYEV